MTGGNRTITYVMSRFPKLTETFVLYEMLELRRRGFRIVVFPLRLEQPDKTHPEAAQLSDEIFDVPLFSLRTLLLNLNWLFRHPVRYLGTALCAAAGTVGCPKFFAGALLYYPKAVVFADTARRLGVDHVHAHFASHPAMVAWVMHRLCGMPYSFTAHGTDLHVHQHMLKEKARDAAFAITISDYNIRFIQDCCGRQTAEQFEVIRCGIDLSRFHPLENEYKGPLEILCIAALRPVKGHRILIDACAKLKERGVDFRCRLVGGGDLEAELRKQIVFQGLEKQVLLEGEKSQPEVQAFLKAADVITLASVQTPRGSREGIPVALMEGMACGLPAVASRISGIPELVGEGVSGLLFEPGNAEEAASAFEKLATDSDLWKQMGLAARRQVEARYDLAQNAQVLAKRIQQATHGTKEGS